MFKLKLNYLHDFLFQRNIIVDDLMSIDEIKVHHYYYEWYRIIFCIKGNILSIHCKIFLGQIYNHLVNLHFLAFLIFIILFLHLQIELLIQNLVVINIINSFISHPDFLNLLNFSLILNIKNLIGIIMI